jgi:hypothetical protein
MKRSRIVRRWEWVSRNAGLIIESTHATEKSAPISEVQAYIAYLISSLVFEVSVLLCSENAVHNGFRNALETVVL